MLSDMKETQTRFPTAGLPPVDQDLLRLLGQQLERIDDYLGSLGELAALAPLPAPINESPFDIAHQLSPLIAQFSHHAKQRGIGLELRWSVPGRMFIGDADRLSALLRHLFDAAARDLGGDTLIEICSAASARARHGGPLIITVESRCAASETHALLERQRRILQHDPLHALATSQRAMSHCLAYLTARGMKGSLTAAERPGGGVSLSVQFRDSRFLGGPALVQVVQLVAPVATGRVPINVLVVDDNRVNQHLLERWLQAAGMQVHTAADGDAAVRAVRERVFDVILMDVSMPVMSGMEVTRAIRGLGLLPDRPVLYALTVPIIGVSARAMAGDRDACLDAGMDDYVTKPIQRDILLTKIARFVVRSGRGASSASLAG